MFSHEKVSGTSGYFVSLFLTSPRSTCSTTVSNNVVSLSWGPGNDLFYRKRGKKVGED